MLKLTEQDKKREVIIVQPSHDSELMELVAQVNSSFIESGIEVFVWYNTKGHWFDLAITLDNDDMVCDTCNHYIVEESVATLGSEMTREQLVFLLRVIDAVNMRNLIDDEGNT